MRKYLMMVILMLMAFSLITCHAETAIDPAEISVGSIITFGHYEQDNDLDNGKEPIEWVVLEYDENNSRVLLISKYILDHRIYNTEETATWETCSLRRWLNVEFLTRAFSKAERTAVLSVRIDNSRSQGYSEWDTDGGNNTYDQVFLLSCQEAKQYLDLQNPNKIHNPKDANKSRTAPTPYAESKGETGDLEWLTVDGEPAAWWWLRSPGMDQRFAICVNHIGSFNSIYVDRTGGTGAGIRPAIWLDLNSSVF